MTHTSREYAEALFELGAEERKTEEFAAALEEVRQALQDHPDFLSLLASPAVTREERADALRAVFQDRIPMQMLALLRLMVFRGHARLLPEMIGNYFDLARENRGESVAKVISAVPLTAAQEAALREKLAKKLGRSIILECRVDPALLGGLRVETEGRVLDGSLQSRLREFREAIDS